MRRQSTELGFLVVYEPINGGINARIPMLSLCVFGHTEDEARSLARLAIRRHVNRPL